MNSLEQHMRGQRDEQIARQSATQILYVLKEFIPDRCFRDALDHMTEGLIKSGAELTNADQRKQYEALKRTIMDPSPIDWMK